MGPPEFTGGNGVNAALIEQARDELQWGRRNSPAETCPVCRAYSRIRCASMGPPEFTGGNRAPSLPSISSTELQWGRRNSPAETPQQCHRLVVDDFRFNGAAGIHRRKHVPQRRPPDARRMASMGPPEFTGGNGTRGYVLPMPAGVLQWGRRNSPAETSRIRCERCSGHSRFNGAAGIHRRKHHRPGDRGGRVPGRFNGAAGIHRRKPATSSVTNCSLISFNGAAGIHRRKRAPAR